MEILVHGVKYKQDKNRVTCSCDCVFIYEENDTKKSLYYEYINCPECGQEIILRMRQMELKIDKTRKSPNFTKGHKVKLDTIVIHDTEGDDIKKTLKWFENKEAQVSAHYVIGKDGAIYQMVEDEDTAWHCGKSCLPDNKKETGGTVNHRSIGIELVNIGDGKHEFPKEQMDSLILLVQELKSKHDIKYVVGHKEIAPGRKTDPAENFDWGKIR